MCEKLHIHVFCLYASCIAYICRLESQFSAVFRPCISFLLIIALEHIKQVVGYGFMCLHFQHHIIYKYLKDFSKASSSCLSSLSVAAFHNLLKRLGAVCYWVKEILLRRNFGLCTNMYCPIMQSDLIHPAVSFIPHH